MFDSIFHSVSPGVTVSAVYRVLLELFGRYGSDLGETRSLADVRSAFRKSTLSLPEKQRSAAVASKILHEIQESKKKELESLSEEEILEISRQLTRAVAQRLAEDARPTVEAEKLLASLREQFPSSGIEGGAAG